MGLDNLHNAANKVDGSEGNGAADAKASNIDWMKGIDFKPTPLGQIKAGDLQKMGQGAADSMDTISHNKDGIDSIGHHNIGPDAIERMRAEVFLASDIDQHAPESQKKALTDLTTALTGGDMEKFGDALKNIPPAELKDTMDSLNKLLKSNHCSSRVDVNADGNVVMSERGGDTALMFDTKSGEVTVKAVQTLDNGAINVLPGEVLNGNSDRLFDSIGNNAVVRVNHPFTIGKPFNPGPGPGRPRIIGLDDSVGPAAQVHVPELQIDGQ